MKKYLIASVMTLFAAFSLVACSEEEGTTPGGDKNPHVTIYQYEAPLPYNADNDVKLRLAANNQVENAYYLAEPANEHDARLKELGEDGYNKYVVDNGTKINLAYPTYTETTEDEDGEEVEGEAVEITSYGRSADVVITDMLGDYVITVVAQSGNTLTAEKINFTGIIWNTLAEGVYYFQNPNMQAISGMSATYTTLQVDNDNPTSYRLKDLWGAGYSMKFFALPDYEGEDEDGVYTFLRVPAQTTGITYGSYGTFYIRDVGYWQNDDSFVTAGGYESGMYEDYTCFFMVQLYNVGGSNFGYQYYDFFIPSDGSEVKARKAPASVRPLEIGTVVLK